MSEDADYGEHDVGAEIDEQVEWAEWLICHVLRKTGRMTLDQWRHAAFAYSYFDDDPDELREKAPELSRLNKKDLAYLLDQLIRHQHGLSDTDYHKTLSASQIQKMRLGGKSLR